MKGTAPWVVAATLLVAVVASAAINATVASLLVTSVVAPPVQLVAGAGASDSRYVTGFAASANKTSFSANFDGKIGEDAFVADVVEVRDMDNTVHNVTLRGSQIANANILTFRWTLMNGTTSVGTLDFSASQPALAFTLPAGATYTLNEELAIASGANGNASSASFTLGVSVS